MTTVVTADHIVKSYGRTTALADVSCVLEEGTIYGLLGRNGAGKTTLMQILTGQGFATSGSVQVFGAAPYENDAVLADVCFVKESQRYPDSFTVRHTLRAAGRLFPNWSEELAQSLVDQFELPRDRRTKKLSRGMLSALGVIIGLASRSRLTLFDEPYLGLDAVARRTFYDRLLADYAEHPRTVLLSTHLIDEVGDLLEHVLLLDRGRLILDDDADKLRSQAVTITGSDESVDTVARSREELHREHLGPVVRATLRGPFAPEQRSWAESLGLEVRPVSLQQLVVHLTGGAGTRTDQEVAQ